MAEQGDYGVFRDWVAEELKRHRGTRFSEDGPEDSPYVPLDRLQEFWTAGRIATFLHARGHQLPHAELLSPEEIQRKFLRIFTALVYMSDTPDHSRMHYLDVFAKKGLDDANLPFREEAQLEGIITGSHRANADRTSFYESQFLFTPHSLAETANGKLMRTMRQTYLAKMEVLPMKLERRINPAANKATGVEVVLFRCHPSSGLMTRNDLVIAKIFPPEEFEDAFANERKTYTRVRSENILAYFGSFVQCHRPVILLEYADKGSLVQFFQENNLPNTRDELTNFWMDLSRLFKSLAVLHNAQPKEPGAVTHVHQDLQPSNIFVFSDVTNGTEDFQYRFRFKLGDFGSSSAKTRAEGSNHYYNRTPRIYGAPELVEFDPSLHDLDTTYTKASDIWSIGCLFLEAAVWSVCGERGRRQFIADRRTETTNEHAAIPACDSTFHNGKTILNTVRNRPTIMQTQVRVFDTLTKPLWDWICTYLLAHKPSHRLEAKQAGRFMRQLIDSTQNLPPAEFRHHVAPPVSQGLSIATKMPRPNSVISNITSLGIGLGAASNPSMPTLQLPERSPSAAHNHGRHQYAGKCGGNASESENGEEKPRSRLSKCPSKSTVGSNGLIVDTPPTTARPSAESGNTGSNKPRNNTRGRSSLSDDLTIERLLQWKPTGPESLLPELLSVQDQLQGRDQVFLIDDSWSMRKHWNEVRKAVEALGLVVQEADPDDMELRFTSRPAKKHKAKKAAALVAHVDGNKPRRTGPCPMEQALNMLIDDLMPRLRSVIKGKVSLTSKARNLLRPNGSAAAKNGISVYVLTNAIWGATTDGGATAGDGRPRMCGVDQSIRTLVARLKREDAMRSYFTIQFIRFGHDAAARARLRYLDDGLKQELPGWDIVDSRSYRRGSVRAMLIGALSELNDESVDSDGDDDDDVDDDGDDDDSLESWDGR